MTTFQKLIEHFIKMPEWATSWVTVTGSEFQKILPKMICFVATLVCFFFCNMCPMPMSTTNSSVIYHLTYESHLQDFDKWLAHGGSTNDICTFYENFCR